MKIDIINIIIDDRYEKQYFTNKSKLQRFYNILWIVYDSLMDSL